MRTRSTLAGAVALMLAMLVAPSGAHAATVAAPGTGAPGAAAGATARTGPDAAAAESRAQRIRATVRGADLRAAATEPTAATGPVKSGPGYAAVPDSSGDSIPNSDLVNVGARLDAGQVRLSATASQPAFITTPNWTGGATFVAWTLDTNGDGARDYDAYLFFDDYGAIAQVAPHTGSSYGCDAAGSYSTTTWTFSVVFSSRCIGAPSSFTFRGYFQYDPDGDADNPFNGWWDWGPDKAAIPVTRGTGSAVTPGGYLIDGNGRFRSFSVTGAVPPVYWADDFPADIARGVAVTPDGGHLYTVDGFGGLHAGGIGANSATGRPLGGPYWPGWDIARGVAVMPNGRGGFVVDGFGGLHRFSIGGSRTPPSVQGAAYFAGRDIARGVTVSPDGRGGYVADLAGGLHPFGIGGAATLPGWTNGGATRGVALTATPLPRVPRAPIPVVPLPGPTDAVVIDPTSTYAYVSTPEQNAVQVVDLRTRTRVTAIPVGESPQGLDLSADGSLLYVADGNSAEISVVATGSRTEMRRIPLPSSEISNPIDVAVGADGKLLVLGFWGVVFKKIDPSNDTVTDFPSVNRYIDLSVSRDRSTMLAVDGGSRIARYDVATGTMVELDNPSGKSSSGGALDADGSAAVVSGTTAVFDELLQPLRTLAIGSHGIAIDDAGSRAYGSNGRYVEVANVTTGAKIGSIPLFDEITTDFYRAGQIALSPDGTTLVVSTVGGVAIVPARPL